MKHFFLSLGKEIESDCFACLVWYKAESNRNTRTKSPPITSNLKLSGQSQQESEAEDWVVDVYRVEHQKENKLERKITVLLGNDLGLVKDTSVLQRGWHVVQLLRGTDHPWCGWLLLMGGPDKKRPEERAMCLFLSSLLQADVSIAATAILRYSRLQLSFQSWQRLVAGPRAENKRLQSAHNSNLDASIPSSPCQGCRKGGQMDTKAKGSGCLQRSCICWTW